MEPESSEFTTSLENDQQCAICQEQMNCLSFNSLLEQGQEGESFRLSCKHAFHSSCILLAFRTLGSTACPCCRNTGVMSGSQVVTRGRFSLHITEIDDEEEEESEIDMMEIMDNDVTLRQVRCSNPEVKFLRRQLKDCRKEYNIFRDQLRHKRRNCIKKALKEFRDEHRDIYRGVRQRLVNRAHDVYEKEKEAFISLTSSEDYEAKPWKELHLAERTGYQFKVQNETRHTDPWNSSFWYA
jgi:hypothetical protein